MYAKKLQPFVSYCTRPPHEGKPQLIVRGWLTCPYCRYVHEIETHPSLLHESTQPQQPKYEVGAFRSAALACIRQHRNCRQCGILSALPERDMAAMINSLAKAITVEWLDQEIAGLARYVSFSDKVIVAEIIANPPTDEEIEYYTEDWRQDGESGGYL
jgi:hypothetical protein